MLRWTAVGAHSPEVKAPGASGPRNVIPFVVAGIAVAAGLAALVLSSGSYVEPGPASGEPYNLLVEGFRSGHLWIAREAPAALAREPNPYLYASYRDYLGSPWNLIDLSYYKGHLYTYFGATPALVLFWPWRVLTGGFLHQSTAVLVFCLAGFFFSLGIAASAWRRYFPRAGSVCQAAVAVLIASLSSLPVFAARPGLFEVAISCAYAFSAASLACLWKAFHGGRSEAAWVAAASLLYGLAVAARPPLLFGAAALMLPAIASFRAAGMGARQGWITLLAALLPIGAVGGCIAAYNFARFGDPLQFGHAYQLSGNDVFGAPSFSAGFLWDNVRLYFLLPPRWHPGFPFVWRPSLPELSRAHLPVEFFYGALAGTPALFAALLVPLLRGMGHRSIPRIASLAMGLLFLAAAAPVCLYAGATSRYLLDFMPPVALLSAVGVMAVEDPECGSIGGLPVLRFSVRAAVVYSIAVAWLLAVALAGFYRNAQGGLALLSSGHGDQAAAAYDEACRMNPDFKGQADLSLGADLLSRGRVAEAESRLRRAVIESPMIGAAHFNLGQAFLAESRFREAADAFSKAVSVDPKDAEAEANLGVALFRLGDTAGAAAHERAALRLQPSLESARGNLRAIEAAQGAAAR